MYPTVPPDTRHQCTASLSDIVAGFAAPLDATRQLHFKAFQPGASTPAPAPAPAPAPTAKSLDPDHAVASRPETAPTSSSTTASDLALQFCTIGADLQATSRSYRTNPNKLLR
ncbi:hypothetical protein E4U41_004746 [Claviceps citrina]|nr:hypothetical protein E4U41_004746 [Claviceps citrina]